jgi:predicted DNA-binding transcriptional regulator YafY
MAEAWGDASLARRARSVLSKVKNVLSEELEQRLERIQPFAPGLHVPERVRPNLGPLRLAITTASKVRLSYTRADGQRSERTVRPLGLLFWRQAWTLVAWCELREDFCSFHPDRMGEVKVLEETFEPEPGRDLDAFLARLAD